MKLRYYLRGLGIGMLVAALVLVLSGETNAKMSDEAVKRRAGELGMVEKDTSVLGDVGAADDAQESGNDAAGTEDGARDDAAGTADDAQEDEDGSAAEAGDEAADGMQESGAADSANAADGVQGGNGTAGGAQGGGTGTAAGGQGSGAASVSDEEKELAEEIEERADEVIDRAEEVAENAPAGRKITFEVVRGDSSVSVARRAQEAGLVVSAADFDAFLCRNGYDKRISIGSYEITEGMSEKEIADIITKSVR